MGIFDARMVGGGIMGILRFSQQTITTATSGTDESAKLAGLMATVAEKNSAVKSINANSTVNSKAASSMFFYGVAGNVELDSSGELSSICFDSWI